MTREEKIEKRKKRSKIRAAKNGARNKGRESRWRYPKSGIDCPYDVEINGVYGSCHCGGVNEHECSQDV